MTDKQKIKEEEDLEEAAEVFYDNCNITKSSWWDEGMLHKMSESKETFIAGAKWQKQQMIKDAVECIVHQCEVNGIKLDGVEILSDGLILDEKIFKDGDKVKIIIIKEY